MHSNMISSILAATLLGLAHAQSKTDPVTGILGNATVTHNNPVGLTYFAKLPEKSFFNPEDPRCNIKGGVSISANPDGTGVKMNVQLANLPTSGGPFLYHIHAKPVPSDGNCTATGGHLDPFERGDLPPCDSAHPETCQVGDFSGKFGKITSDPYEKAYLDLFASTNPDFASFVGNLSLVVHFANKTRITCANFHLVDEISPREGDNCTDTATGSGSGNSTKPEGSAAIGPGSGNSTKPEGSAAIGPGSGNSTKPGGSASATGPGSGEPITYTSAGASGSLGVRGSLMAVLGAALAFAL